MDVNTKLDLSKTSDLELYLAKTAFAAVDDNEERIIPLGGGFANWTYRVYLEKEYEGRKTAVVKHAKGWVKDMPDFKYDVVKQKYEVEALRRVGAWVGKESKVKVAEVYLFDEEENVIVMEDAGENALTLKELVRRGLCTAATGVEIGQALGEFLGKMHVWGRGNKELCDVVKGHVQAKVISARAYYGRLEDTLNGKSGLAKLSDPDLVVGEEDMKTIKAFVEKTTQAIVSAQDAFTMGDFWPGNMMVNLDSQGELVDVMVLDWEVVKTGLPPLDVGQFCAEIDMLRRTGYEEAASAILSHFLSEYQHAGGQWNKEEERLAKAHWGVHMAVLAARVEWGDKRITQELVLAGVSLLLDNCKGDR